MTKYPELFNALFAKFADGELRCRKQAGRDLYYITARTAMNRLDDVLGPENWWDEYVPAENSVLCRLTIRLPDGSELTKADAGGYAGMADSGDDDKSGYSDAFKRAAVKFGVGRYIYNDGFPNFHAAVQVVPEVVAPEPSRPPVVEAPAPTPQPVAAAGSNGHANGHANGHVKQRNTWGSPRPAESGQVATRPAGESKAPKTGRALFAWAKDQEEKFQVGVVRYLNGWGKLQDFPGRMVDWDSDQVAQAHAEVIRKLQSIPPGDAYEGD